MNTRVTTAYIALEEKRDRQTREALAEVDAGYVIDHAEIEAWADVLDAPAKWRSPIGRV